MATTGSSSVLSNLARSAQSRAQTAHALRVSPMPDASTPTGAASASTGGSLQSGQGPQPASMARERMLAATQKFLEGLTQPLPAAAGSAGQVPGMTAQGRVADPRTGLGLPAQPSTNSQAPARPQY